MKEDIVVFNGYEFESNSRGYYMRRGPYNLHRAVWEYHCGEISSGYAVHHIDGDVSNNDISNLECLPITEHKKIHGQKMSTYSKTEEGKEFFKSIGKASWQNREWVTKSCLLCGGEYKTPYPNRARYCSSACRQKSNRLYKGYPMRTVKNCAYCGKEFETYQKKKARYCSARCRKGMYYARSRK